MAAKGWLEFKGKKPKRAHQYNRKSSESLTRGGLKNNNNNKQTGNSQSWDYYAAVEKNKALCIYWHEKEL